MYGNSWDIYRTLCKHCSYSSRFSFSWNRNVVEGSIEALLSALPTAVKSQILLSKCLYGLVVKMQHWAKQHTLRMKRCWFNPSIKQHIFPSLTGFSGFVLGVHLWFQFIKQNVKWMSLHMYTRFCIKAVVPNADNSCSF